MIKNRRFRIDYPRALLLALSFMSSAVVHAEPVQTPHVEAELIAETTQFTKGGDNWLALRLKPEQGWHVYWRNPGDSGLPTSIAWTLPEGVSAGDINWPYPQRETLGGIVNYGYGDETLLLVPLQLADAVPAGAPLTLHARAKWLVCKDSCIPGSAELSLTRPVSAGGAAEIDDQWRSAFASTRDHLPQPAPADWKASFAIDTAHKDFTLAITGARISSAGSAAFFPYEKNLINHSSPSRKANDAKHGLRISRALSDYFADAPEQVDGVLLLHDGSADKAWEIHAQPGIITAVPASAVDDDGATASAAGPERSAPNLALALLLALLGGLVLNLMPCVFPVLSFKAISLIEARGSTARKQRAHALAYTAGVLGTFLGLAGLLLILRGAGSAIGWGFQLQQPAFVAALIYLFFAMALSMSGIVEFGTRLMGVGSSLASAAGYRGSFFSGALAVAVASPCTAPFMGTALGYALGQPAAVALSVFVALGLGLAAPFLLLGFVPALGRWLPKPGAWMTTFRQLMAFPLYLTVVWLLWVLDGLSGRDASAVALVGMTLIAFALWLWHRAGAVAHLARLAALALAATTLAIGPATELAASTAPITAGDAADGRPSFEPWSEARVAALRAQGRTVLVDFTADWCLTCKINENGALASASARRAFADRDVALLRADWTHADPAIAKALEGFGRSGVPVYVVYVDGGAPKLLPQLLTPSAIVEALAAP